MKNNLRTFTFRGKIQGCEEFFSYLQIVEGLVTEDKFQNKNETKNERKKEKEKKRNFQEGRGTKPKMQTSLNSQVTRKVKKVKTKQTKKRQKKLYIMKAR